MKKSTKKQFFFDKLPLKPLAGIAVVAVLVLAGYLIFFKNDPAPQTGVTGTTADGKKVDLSPATQNDQQAADDNKADIVKRDESIKSQSGTNQSSNVSVVITEATSGGVRGYVQGVFEDGGTCTATATQGSQTYTKTSVGFQNVSNTQCPPINWDSVLGSGSWAITLSYKSSTAQGTQTVNKQL